MTTNDALSDEPAEPPRRAVRGFSSILVGTALGQVVTFLALPFLSRIYSPEDFGVLAFSLSVTSVLVPVSLFGFDLVIVRPRDERSVTPILASALIALVASCIVVGLVFWFAPVSTAFAPSTRAWLIWTVPILLFTSGLAALLNQVAIRGGKYGTIGRRNSIQSVAITAAQLALAPIARFFSSSGLVIGTIAGTAVGAALLTPYALPYRRNVPRSELTSVAKTYWRYPLVFAPMSALTLLSQQAPTLVTVSVFGAASAGQVGMAERLVAVPLALIGMAAGTVFTGELAHVVRAGSVSGRSVYLRTSMWLAIPSVLSAAALFFLATSLIPLFLGRQWAVAGQVAQIMALVAATRMMTNPTRQVFRVTGRARALLFVECQRLGLLALAVGTLLFAKLPLSDALVLLYSALAIADVVTWFVGLHVSRRAS